MTTRELLEAYYRGLARKQDWESVIAADFKFATGDMTKTTPIIGRDAYREVIRRFAALFTSVRIAEMIVDGDRAFVRASYDFVFPNGKNIRGDVAELWTAREGKLSALTIFFDTATFSSLIKSD